MLTNFLKEQKLFGFCVKNNVEEFLKTEEVNLQK